METRKFRYLRSHIEKLDQFWDETRKIPKGQQKTLKSPFMVPNVVKISSKQFFHNMFHITHFSFIRILSKKHRESDLVQRLTFTKNVEELTHVMKNIT